MKKITLFSALAIGLFISCKKSNSGSTSSYHVTATIDGTAKTFNVSPIATRITNGGVTLISVTGFSAASSTTETLSLALSNNLGAATVYKAGTYADTASLYAVSGIYQASLASQYVSGTNVTQMAVGGGAPITNHFKLIITSIDSTSIKGTFSGDYFYNADPTAAKKTVTNGDFYAKFQ